MSTSFPKRKLPCPARKINVGFGPTPAVGGGVIATGGGVVTGQIARVGVGLPAPTSAEEHPSALRSNSSTSHRILSLLHHHASGVPYAEVTDAGGGQLNRDRYGARRSSPSRQLAALSRLAAGGRVPHDPEQPRPRRRRAPRSGRIASTGGSPLSRRQACLLGALVPSPQGT